jgi:hypothetical protein
MEKVLPVQHCKFLLLHHRSRDLEKELRNE